MRFNILLVILIALSTSPTTATKKRQRLPTHLNIEDLNKGFRNNPSATARLLASATRTDGRPARSLEDYSAYSHIAQYSIQFQGCHHVQQWNSENYYEDEIRVLTKRLVRFRLIPYADCKVVPAWAGYLETVKNSVGQFDDFGEYIIDLNEFVYSYLVALSEGAGSGDGLSCDDYGEACEETCGNDNGNDDADSCMTQCYEFYSCDTDDAAADDADDANAEDKIDALDYAQCAQIDYEPYDDAAYDDDDDDGEYYVGPFCANHGAEIQMGLFSDDTCTTTARCNGGASRGATCYEEVMGVALPYSDASIVQDPCITCSQNYVALSRLAEQEADSGVEVQYEFGYTRDVCANLYDASGKCESHMSQGYQYDYACDYIEGIKIAVSDDGVVYGVKRSSKVDKALLGLVVSSTLVGMYVYYLKYRLDCLPSQG